MTNERKNYKDVLNKFEVLQKEQLDAKSKLTAEKEKLQRYIRNYILIFVMYFKSLYKMNFFFSLLESKKKDSLKVELELKTLKEKYNNSIDIWNKQKLEMQVNYKHNMLLC